MPRVLVIEDSSADVDLLRYAFRDAGLDVELETIPDGLVAIHRFHDYADQLAEPPDLVLLDLNLPQVSGQEILREIRKRRSLADTPIVILSSSVHARDEVEELGVERFIAKPRRYHDLVDALKDLEPLLASSASTGAP